MKKKRGEKNSTKEYKDFYKKEREEKKKKERSQKELLTELQMKIMNNSDFVSFN
jgi:hypothetical protein